MLRFTVADPEEVYRTLVGARRVLYLDHNVWIDLADRKSSLAQEVFELARMAVDVGVLICPVSYPSITELLKQGKNASSMRQAHTMDALCVGVSIRAERHVIDEEVIYAHTALTKGSATPTRDKMFTAVGCYLADGELQFPDGWEIDDAAELADTIRRNLPSVTWLLEHLPVPKFQQRHSAGDQRYLDKVRSLNSDLSDFRDKNGKLNAQKLRLEEHTYVLKNYILPRLPRLVGLSGMIRGLADFKARKVKPGAAALARIVDAMPSTSLSCELHVQRRLAARQPEPQDLYDQEHAVLGVPYCDAFGSSDGELLDSLRKAKATERYGTMLLRGPSEIRRYVAGLLDSVTIRA